MYTSQACEASSPKATVLVYSLGWHYIEVGQHAGVRAGRLLQPACAQFCHDKPPFNPYSFMFLGADTVRFASSQ